MLRSKYMFLKKIFFVILCFFAFVNTSFASTALVENVFSDISSDYIYRDELQSLYDRGTIVADASGRFNPNQLLNRDEFVGISMEVICERCIQPHTEFRFIEKYFNEDVYFDINNTNPYFYCVAEADTQNYVRWYDIGQSCQDGTSSFGQRPFCPQNTINLEEAIAVLLRNSGIFTIDDNAQVIQDIRNNSISLTLWNDVPPIDNLWNPYTFYGYLQKALEYEISEFDALWNEKVLKLLELDSNGNINPKKQVTKEEFLRMSYIALKSNSCEPVTGSQLALKMLIWEDTCEQGNTSECQLSDLQDPDDTYDFEPEVEGFCEEWISDPTGYIWRFQNLTTGEQQIQYGKYIDDYTLSSPWEWRVYLRVSDNCGNSSEIYSTIFVTDSETEVPEEALNVSIDATPIIGFEDLEVYFDGIVSGWSLPYTYQWEFWDGEEWFSQDIDHLYINDGTYNVLFTATDINGLSGSATVIIIVQDRDICEQDSDGDSIVDCDDVCPLVPWSINNSGCPVLETSCSENCGCEEWYSCSDSDPLTCWAWVCLPDFDPEITCLYTPEIWGIYGNALCSSCPCDNAVDFLADIRRCDLVFPAITSPDARDIYSRWSIWQVQ